MLTPRVTMGLNPGPCHSSSVGSGRAGERCKGDKSSRLYVVPPCRLTRLPSSFFDPLSMKRCFASGVQWAVQEKASDRQMMRGTWICVSRVDISGDV